ncbi:MAG TPA: glycosyltransferase [Jatrophihabitans sp.]|nr:glycosyltransferase [Jatrophihabitans sp.]
MRQVEIRPTPLAQLGALLTAERRDRFLTTATAARTMLAGRVVWNVNATAHGGGVAEMLQILLAYGRAAGVDTRWLVLDGDPAFFALTKRLHNCLHGLPGPAFTGADRRHYERVLAGNAEMLRQLVAPGDLVLLHDPQTAGLAAALRSRGARVVWRSHIGRDTPNEATERGWAFLRGYLEPAEACVFSRREYAPGWLPAGRVWVIAPSIDPTALKNRELPAAEVRRVLGLAGVLAGDGAPVPFVRRDGSPGVLGALPPLPPLLPEPLPDDAPLVVQVSRWDRLKDMAGVLVAFAELVATAVPEAHLVLAGPELAGVADDPEDAAVLAECRAVHERLPGPVRARCHLVCLPMADPDANALLVNAVQRWARVVVQKSLVEGFGLTVTEAMWKARPVLAGAVGGIRDQITDGVDGLLVPEPADLAGFGDRLRRLLADEALCRRLGRAGRERVRAAYLGDRHLIQWVELFQRLV